MQLNGARILIECLIREGVNIIFGYPGGSVLDIYDELPQYGEQLRHVLVRHEQAAVHAADGYARATGKVGVCMATSGPGATNTVTGIATAYCDSIPMVIFTGQVPTGLIGNDAFQEVDIAGITRPCTKHNYVVKDVKDLAKVVRQAFYLARSGRPGPVLVDLPKNVLQGSAEFVWPEDVSLRSYNPTYRPNYAQIRKVVDALYNAERPLLFGGGGVIMSNASEEFRNLAKNLSIPVTCSLMGLGAFPCDHPQGLGMLGMHGTYAANKAGSRDYEDDFILMPNAETYYNVDFPEGAKYYKELRSDIRMWNFGLNFEVNMFNLFRRSDGNRRWALLVAPGIYMQKFSTEVEEKGSGNRFADKLSNKVNLGLGGDVALRYRINKHLDAQLKGGMMWINNNKFDGIKTICNCKRNTMFTAQVGLVWKIGNGKSGKKDNIMYAPGYLPMWKRATKTVTKVVHDTIYIEQKVLEKSPEVVVCKGFPKDLPAVYFERGKWKLDTDKYARELFTIAKTLKENPEVQIDICGYADHTGGKGVVVISKCANK